VSTIDKLVDQQITLHEAQLKRIDELFQRVERAGDTDGVKDPLLAALADERNTLASLLMDMKNVPHEDWQQVADRHFGPLAIWEALARVLEGTIERLEKGSR
jgi:hypothetical protein